MKTLQYRIDALREEFQDQRPDVAMVLDELMEKIRSLEDVGEIYQLGREMPEEHIWCGETIQTLCEKIDKCGGWNPKARSVKFFHGDKRSLIFSDNYQNSGYWTVCLTVDDYYWHKLSASKKEEFACDIRMKIRSRI